MTFIDIEVLKLIGGDDRMKNKTKLIVLITIYLFCVTISLFVQIIIDKPIIHWGIIISVITFMVLIPIIKVIKEFLISKRLMNNISENNYQEVHKISKEAKFLHNNKLSLYEQQICYFLAVFFYENNDPDYFKYYISKITNKKIIAFKYFWKSLIACNINDNEKFNKKYELFIKNKCLYKRWQGAYKEYAEILKLLSDYTNSNALNVEKFNYYKNKVTFKILRELFTRIEVSVSAPR